MRIKALIPACGYGTRVGMLPHQSKELIIDPGTNQPLIQWHLDICKKYNIEPLVIVRKEKIELIEYCKQQNVQYVVIEPEGEWPNTILKAKDHWGDANILLLPDTRWSDENVLVNIKKSLQNHKSFAIAKHWVTDGDKWGMLRNSDGYDIIMEKSPSLRIGWAWGILGFNKKVGENLFSALLCEKQYRIEDRQFFILRWFKDITR